MWDSRRVHPFDPHLPCWAYLVVSRVPHSGNMPGKPTSEADLPPYPQKTLVVVPADGEVVSAPLPLTRDELKALLVKLDEAPWHRQANGFRTKDSIAIVKEFIDEHNEKPWDESILKAIHQL